MWHSNTWVESKLGTLGRERGGEASGSAPFGGLPLIEANICVRIPSSNCRVWIDCSDCTAAVQVAPQAIEGGASNCQGAMSGCPN